MKLTPYFVDGSPPATNADEAFLRVRVAADGLNPQGFVRVWLPSGTPLIVQGRELLRSDTGGSHSALSSSMFDGRVTAGDLLHAWFSKAQHPKP